MNWYQMWDEEDGAGYFVRATSPREAKAKAKSFAISAEADRYSPGDQYFAAISPEDVDGLRIRQVPNRDLRQHLRDNRGAYVMRTNDIYVFGDL